MSSSVPTKAWPHMEPHQRIGDFLKEAVFGFNDGLVSTFAVIAGLTGGAVENKTVLLAALATLVAGGFSMGLGTYLGSKSEKDHYESERKRELWEMEHMPEAEVQEIRDIYSAKGFEGELLEKVVAKITSDPDLWLETMMREELGFAEEPPNPRLNGITMSVSFIAGAAIPTLPYFLNKIGIFCTNHINCPALPFWERDPMIFLTCAVLSVLGLLFAGAYKTRFTKVNIFVSALETLLIGAIAAGGSYWVGVALM